MKICFFIECVFDYFPPFFCRQVLAFYAVESPVAVGAVQVADVVDVYRAINGLFYLKQSERRDFCKKVEVK
jgi:hypothetical protein